MKKLLILMLSVIALFAFVATSFALHAVPENYEYSPAVVKAKKSMIELGGELRMRGIYENNNDLVDTESDGDTNDDQEASYDYRFRLDTKATVSPNTMGFIQLETGDENRADEVWGTCTSEANGVYDFASSGNCKGETITIRQAYIAHQGTGLGMLSGFKVGHMLLALGNGMFFNHTDWGDDAIILWMQPADGTEISLATIKFQDSNNLGTTTTADDSDAYVLMGESAIGNINLSGDVTLVHDNQSPAGDKGIKLWNIGVRADADLGVAMVKGDLEFQTGKIEGTQAGGDDMDLGGWAMMIGADFKLGEVNLGAEFAYGSGDDIDTEDEYEGFVTSLADGQRSSFLADYRLDGSGQAIVVGSTTTSSAWASDNNHGLNNHWYLNVGADAKVHPDVKVSGDVYYLSATEKVANDTATAELEDTYMGVEVDAKVTYQIDTNLVYYIEGGYLFAGDFYKNATLGKDPDNSLNANSPDNAYTVRHGIILSF